MISNERLIGYFLLTLFSMSAAYRHVIFMHGLLGGVHELDDIKMNLKKYHPGTNVTFIDSFDRLSSLRPLWIQIQIVRQRMFDVMTSHPEGVHLLCFSQGGLICRGVVETLPNHNVINFISLSSPQGGQYGSTDYLSPPFHDYMKKDLYRIFYTKKGQNFVSIANYWNDPHQQPLYRKWSSFLALINNQSSTNDTFSQQYKDSFVRLKNFIMVGGPDDGVVQPWQSSLFAAYNEKEEVQEMYDQQWYKEDWFGLKMLDDRGSLHTCVVPEVHHTRWHKNLTVFLKCIEPWLD